VHTGTEFCVHFEVTWFAVFDVRWDIVVAHFEAVRSIRGAVIGNEEGAGLKGP
jgi:hypothetical protein